MPSNIKMSNVYLAQTIIILVDYYNKINPCLTKATAVLGIVFVMGGNFVAWLRFLRQMLSSPHSTQHWHYYYNIHDNNSLVLSSLSFLDLALGKFLRSTFLWGEEKDWEGGRNIPVLSSTDLNVFLLCCAILSILLLLLLLLLLLIMKYNDVASSFLLVVVATTTTAAAAIFVLRRCHHEVQYITVELVLFLCP